MERKNILIIEDDCSIQRLLKRTLEREGYAVAVAANGRAGIRSFGSQPFDVVITDLIMPEMEGIETIIRLKRDNPDVKIIAMSGGGINSSTEYLDIARQLGAAKTFAKPLQRAVLLEAVAELSA